MKYEYITFRKQLPRGKWDVDPETPVRVFNSKKAAMDEFIGRHGKTQGLGWAGHYGTESVTNIRKGGDSKDTDRFDYFFDYTMVWGTERVRYREAVRPVTR